jgi:hypothetical protein
MRIWPSLGRRAHLATRVFGEVALAAVLGLTLALAWSDGTPNSDPFNTVAMPQLAGIAALPVSGNNLYSGKPVLIPKPPAPTPIPEAPIPKSPPVRLFLPTLNLHPPVEPLGLDRWGALDVPNNIWDVGWYNAGPVPGAPGDAVMDGHAGYPGQPLIFGRLSKIHPGEAIVVLLADGSKQVFKVVSVQSLPVGSTPPGMFEPYGLPRLTLITCDGVFNSDDKTYSNRLIVEASYAGVGT